MKKIGKDIPIIGEPEKWLKVSIEGDKVRYEVSPGLSPFDAISFATGIINAETKRIAESMAKDKTDKTLH